MRRIRLRSCGSRLESVTAESVFIDQNLLRFSAFRGLYGFAAFKRAAQSGKAGSDSTARPPRVRERSTIELFGDCQPGTKLIRV
jgi:hypothetical protein